METKEQRKERNHKNYLKNIAKNPDYNKDFYIRSKDKVAYKKAHRKAVKKYNKNNIIKRRAKDIAEYHTKINGQLCERCKINKAKDRHHPDYSKPLMVELLCHNCHRIVHFDNNIQGCRKYFANEDRRCGDEYGYRPYERRKYIKQKAEYDFWLCQECEKKDKLSKEKK